jgi:hypothetical protein
MNYDTWKQAVESLEKSISIASGKLKQYPRNSMGLVPDSVRTSHDYIRDKREFDTFFKALQVINKGQTDYMKRAAKERRPQS